MNARQVIEAESPKMFLRHAPPPTIDKPMKFGKVLEGAWFRVGRFTFKRLPIITDKEPYDEGAEVMSAPHQKTVGETWAFDYNSMVYPTTWSPEKAQRPRPGNYGPVGEGEDPKTFPRRRDMKAREVIEAVVTQFQRGAWSTEHIKASMSWGHRITLHVTQITTDDPKQAVSEAADLAEQIGAYIINARQNGYWHALARLNFNAVGHPLGQAIIDQIRDELLDMNVLGTQSIGGFQVIVPFMHKAKSKKSTKYSMGYKGAGPRWKSVHSAPGHTNFGYLP